MKKFLTCVLLLSSVSFGLNAQNMDWYPDEDDVNVQTFPIDPAVHYGKLMNGMSYYILQNDKAEHKVELYLAQRAGSILEKDEQAGFAHLLEHLIFEGSKNFPGNSMREFLQRNGVALDETTAAVTSFDQTVYCLTKVPTTQNPNIIDSCLMILHDWSTALSLDGDKIAKAKEIVRKELVERDNAASRMYENDILPKLMPETKYANRYPFGTKDLVFDFNDQALRDFYHEWYRPDLQSVIIVGDVNVYDVEKKIKEIWKDVPARFDFTPRYYSKISDNKDIMAAVSVDKDYHYNIIQLGTKVRKLSPRLRNSQVGFIRAVIRDIMLSAFRIRVERASIVKRPGCLIQSTLAEMGDYMMCTKSRKSLNFTIAFEGNDWKSAVEYIMSIVGDIYSNGFTENEISLAKEELRADLEGRYKNKDNRTNEDYVGKLLDHVLEAKAFLDMDVEYSLVTQLLETLPDEVYQETFQKLAHKDRSQYIFFMGQAKKEMKVPTEEELAKTFYDGIHKGYMLHR